MIDLLNTSRKRDPFLPCVFRDAVQRHGNARQLLYIMTTTLDTRKRNSRSSPAQEKTQLLSEIQTDFYEASNVRLTLLSLLLGAPSGRLAPKLPSGGGRKDFCKTLELRNGGPPVVIQTHMEESDLVNTNREPSNDVGVNGRSTYAIVRRPRRVLQPNDHFLFFCHQGITIGTRFSVRRVAQFFFRLPTHTLCIIDRLMINLLFCEVKIERAPSRTNKTLTFPYEILPLVSITYSCGRTRGGGINRGSSDLELLIEE